jgi:LuxR family quorum sensing-dependent transcriptional regulator
LTTAKTLHIHFAVHQKLALAAMLKVGHIAIQAKVAGIAWQSMTLLNLQQLRRYIATRFLNGEPGECEMPEKAAFGWVEDLRKAKTVENVKSIFGRAVSAYGGSAFIICDIPPGAKPEPHDIHASGWNSQWEEKYVANSYVLDDPIPNYIGKTIDPYYWHEASRGAQKESTALRIMNEARSEFRMVDGLCIPIHGLSGAAGLVSIATEEPHWSLSEQENAALHMIGLYAYEAIRRLSPRKTRVGDQVSLSPRETECVKWIAEGKTTWETSVILGIAEETARQYLRNASQKLDTRTRAHLVSRAHRMNLLQ